MMHHKLKIAIYVRVSTDGQAEDGYSIAAQEAAAKQYAQLMGYEIIEIYIDRGISGKAMENRPALMKMLDDAETKKFEMIIVWKLNRLSRSHLDLLKIYENLEKSDVSFKSITEPFDTSNPAGKLLFNMLASIGEFERETIVENVKNGMKQRAKEGGFNGGRMLGYKSQFIDDSDKRKIVIVGEEAEIVRLMFELYVNGKGYKFIANKLNELGLKTVKGNSFNIQSVRDIIMNPTYAGMIRYNNYVNHTKKRRKGNKNELIITKGEHEAIIDAETWNKAEAIFKAKTGRSRKVHKGVFLLTGIIKCPMCGASMVAGRVSKKNKDGTKTKYSYYQCSRYKNYGRYECSPNSVRADYAENYVLDTIGRLALDRKFIKEVVGNINNGVKKTVKPILKRIKQLENIINDVENKKERVFTLYEEKIIDREVLQQRVMKIQKEAEKALNQKEALLNQIDDAEVVNEIPVKQIKSLLKNLGSILRISTREQKKMLLNLVIDKVEVSDNKEIKNIKIKFSVESQKILLKEEFSDENSSTFVPFSIEIC